jgi:CheY-like chemotaxis protein
MTRISLVYVDDNAEDRRVVRDDIERHLENPITYLSKGQELIERMENKQLQQPGILLVDLDLPGGMSGYELIHAIRHRYKYMDRCPIIVVTAASDEESQETAKMVGADAYIHKPITIFSLMYVLRKLGRYGLEIHDRRQELHA